MNNQNSNSNLFSSFWIIFTAVANVFATICGLQMWGFTFGFFLRLTFGWMYLIGWVIEQNPDFLALLQSIAQFINRING